MKCFLIPLILGLPYLASAHDIQGPVPTRTLEILDQNKKLLKDQESQRTRSLFENKDLGIIEYEDHCKKESLEEAAIKGISGLGSNCKRNYYLRLRILCVDQKSPNIVEIPFPRKNVTITAKNRTAFVEIAQGSAKRLVFTIDLSEELA